MSRYYRILGVSVALTAVALLPACSNAPMAADGTAPRAGVDERDTAALFQTDSLTYTLRAGSHGYEGHIAVQFTNRKGSAVYFVNCNGATSLSLEKRINDRWEAVWSPALQLCLSAPITVLPGATYDTYIRVYGGYPGSNSAPQFSVRDIAGVYRAVWHHALSSYQDRLPFGEPLAFEERISNRFTLLVAPR